MAQAQTLEILKRVLSKIKPTAQEEGRLQEFLEQLHAETEKLGYTGIAVGSTGKQTWLRGDHDVDWFILFPKDVPRDELEKRGLEIGAALARALKGKSVRKYAEHPYTRIFIAKGKSERKSPGTSKRPGAGGNKIAGPDNFGSWFIDVVPCYRIAKGEHIISAVDRSPLHLEFVRDSLSTGMQDETRLLKQFMKGSGVYGSDARHEGFSGYIAELLIIRHKTFLDVLDEAAKWLPGTRIVLAKDSGQKFKDPLIIIDPVDQNRNVSASLSFENFMRFVLAARKFLEQPSEKYFTADSSPLSAKETAVLKNRGTYWFAFVSMKPDVIDDTLWPQMRRAVKRIAKMLDHEEFKVIRQGEFANGSMVLFFELEYDKLPPVKKMTGPPVFVKKHADEFLKKYSAPLFGPHIEGENWVVEKEREFMHAHQVRSLAKKSPGDLETFGIPSFVAQALSGARFLDSENFWSFVRNNKNFSAHLRRKYIERMM